LAILAERSRPQSGPFTLAERSQFFASDEILGLITHDPLAPA
jgi:hypothetical protein